MRRHLFIGAHPDDIEFGCASVISELGGENCVFVILSGSQERQAESLRAARQLGVDSVYFIGLDDGHIECLPEVIDSVSCIADQEGAETIWVNHPDDSHQDHRNAALIAGSVRRKRMNLVYYRAFSSDSFRVNMFVPVRDESVRKRALTAHKSQISKYAGRGIDFIGFADDICRVNGQEIGVESAEGFQIAFLKGDSLWRFRF